MHCNLEQSMKITVGRPEQPVFHPVTAVFETREDMALLVAGLLMAPSSEVAKKAHRMLFGQDGYSDHLLHAHLTQWARLKAAYAEAVKS